MIQVHNFRPLAIVLIVAAHVVEIVVFAGGWALLERLVGPQLSFPDPDFADLVYFSGSVYTSLGFGDIVPEGPSRVLAVVEAVTGLVLIAWTASFTFLQMRESWDGNRRGLPSSRP